MRINEIYISLGTWIKTTNTRSQPDKILRPKEGIKVGLNVITIMNLTLDPKYLFIH